MAEKIRWASEEWNGKRGKDLRHIKGLKRLI